MQSFSSKQISNYYIRTALPIIFLFLCKNAESQSGIKGLVTDNNQLPVARASLLLLNANDSSLVKGTFSEANGTYHFTGIVRGNYIVSASYTGFQQTYSAAFGCDGIGVSTCDPLVIRKADTALREVTVLAKRPLIELKSDRMVINLENSTSAVAQDALDVLDRAPGIQVDLQNNTISMKGKSGISLMLNGKTLSMPAELVLDWLKSIPAGSIEKIELITTPPASGDAGGNGGYINIVMKKGKHAGNYGSLSATMGYGNGPVTEAALNINKTAKKLNLFGNFSYQRINKPLPIVEDTKVLSQGVFSENQFNGDRVETNRVIVGSAGINYQLSKKTTAGLVVTGYYSRYTHHENNENKVLVNGSLDTVIRQSNSEVKTWQNISFGTNLSHHLANGGVLSFDLDYLYYKNKQPYQYYSAWYTPSGNFLNDQNKKSDKLTPVSFFVMAMSYQKSFGQKIVMDAGIKATNSHFTNRLDVSRLTGSGWRYDSILSSTDRLREYTTALYGSFNIIPAKKVHVNAGLRYEFTSYDLNSSTKDASAGSRYGNLFPVVAVSYQFNEKNVLHFSAARRITRPTFNDLAPYTYFINENTIITGNPSLQPSFANSLTADYGFEKYTVSVSFSREIHPIAAFQPTVDILSGKTIFTARNLSRQLLIPVIFSVPVSLTGWWQLENHVTATWQQVQLTESAGLQNQRININVSLVQHFLLPANTTFELSGFYQSSRLQGINTQKGYGSLDAAIRKKLGAEKGSITLSAMDILNSQAFILNSNFPGNIPSSYMHVNFTQRTIKLSYNRTFGNNKLAQKKAPISITSEERNRMQ